MTGLALQAVELQVEQALAQWRQWSCAPALPGAPHLERRLDGGLSNHSFLVGAAGRRFVLRIDGPRSARHGLNRQAEWLILQSAHAAGIAPEPCYFNPEIGALVCAYLPADEAQAVDPAALAALLRRVHALPARRLRLDLAERIARYEGMLAREHGLALPEPLRRELARRLAHDPPFAAPLALCHNDLLPANLLRSGGGLFALDWEYSAMGSPWFDLAGAAIGQSLDRDGEAELLGCYLGQAPAPAQLEELRRQRVLCRHLELLWHLVEAPPDRAPRVLAERLPALEAALA